VEGKQYILREAPIDVCPMYIKEGSLIPTYDVVQYVGEKPYDTLTLLATPGKASYTHFQDNGEDYAYQQGEYNLYEFTVDEAGELHTDMKHQGYTVYNTIQVCKLGK
jgi:alpha-glucosidase